MTPREILPHRRMSETVTVPWRNHDLQVTVGYYDDGRPGEVFGKSGKEGQELGATIDEASQLISRLLQRGVTVGEIAGGIGVDHMGEPETPIGALVVGLQSLTTEGAAHD